MRSWWPKVYSSYQERLLNANALDFDDLLVFTVDILKSFSGYKEKISGKIPVYTGR